MPTLEYPSTTYPGRPVLELELPDGWVAAPAATHAPGVVLAAVKEGDEQTFRPNVVVSLAQVDPGHTPMTDLEALEADAATRTEGVAGEIKGRTIDGVTYYGRDVSYIDDVAGTLLATTLFGFLRRDADGVLVRITVVGTIGTANHRAEYAELQGVIEGLTVTPAPGTTPIVDTTGEQA